MCQVFVYGFRPVQRWRYRKIPGVNAFEPASWPRVQMPGQMPGWDAWPWHIPNRPRIRTSLAAVKLS